MTVTSADDFLKHVERRHPHDPDYYHAVADVVSDVWDIYSAQDEHRKNRVLDRLTEPDRVISFRVTWEDDEGCVHVNRGYRVQQNNAIGPYKGGIRFHRELTLGTLKFLAFEQTFKNALTGLPMGGGKGGADFDPAGKSDREIMRFCQAFMTELCRHIGPDTDVPAGDINVGPREIGYMFGTYRKLRNEYDGVLTGKGLSFGGSPLRKEATGFGLIHFIRAIANKNDRKLEGQRVAVSGAGNVATHAAECAVEQGAKVISLSDSGGALICTTGFEIDTIRAARDFKGYGGRLTDFANEHGYDFEADGTPWSLACDIALPCATQNELDESAARALRDGDCWLIGEGANMPLTPEANSVLTEGEIIVAPAKAANAGGVAVSGLEIMQNQMRKPKIREEVSDELSRIMAEIHETCVEHGEDESGRIDYGRGANIASYLRVSEALIAQGLG